MTEERPRPERPQTAEKTEGDPAEGFLGRWSRRKLAEPNLPAETDTMPASRDQSLGNQSPEDRAPEAEPAPVRPEDLPDIDSLDEHSDYTVFLKEGVPEVLKRKALRRLWRSNPVFANLDGLAEYDEDYSDAATLVAGVKSLFKAGKGMREGDDEAPEAAPEVAEESADSEVAEAGADEARTEGPAAAEEEGAPAAAPDQPAQEQAPAEDAPGSGVAAKETRHEEVPRPAPGSAAKRRWGAFES